MRFSHDIVTAFAIVTFSYAVMLLVQLLFALTKHVFERKIHVILLH